MSWKEREKASAAGGKREGEWKKRGEKGGSPPSSLLSMGPEHGIGKDIHPDWDYSEGRLVYCC